MVHSTSVSHMSNFNLTNCYANVNIRNVLFLEHTDVYVWFILNRYILLCKKMQHFNQLLLQDPAVERWISTFLCQEIFADADGDFIDNPGILRGNAGAEIAYIDSPIFLVFIT